MHGFLRRAVTFSLFKDSTCIARAKRKHHPQLEKIYTLTCAPNEDSNQTAGSLRCPNEKKENL